MRWFKQPSGLLMPNSGQDTLDLDGVAAAPAHHKVLFENSEVRVVETIVPAGDTTPIHTHPKRISYVVSGSHFIRRDETGNVTLDTREGDVELSRSSVRWSDGTPAHSIENPSNEDLVVIAVELKR